MERLKQKMANAKRALKTLQELLGSKSLTIVERDAAIQRFEYTFEALWKAGKAFLREIEGLEIGSLRGYPWIPSSWFIYGRTDCFGPRHG